MARWLVRLTGDPFWLEEYVLWFPDGDVFVSNEDEGFWLEGAYLDDIGDAAAIREHAEDVVDRMFVAASLMNESVDRPGVGHVVRIDDDGKKTAFAKASVTAVGRAKVRGTVVIDGIPRRQPSTDLAQQLSQRVDGSPHLAAAVQLWANPARTWTRLYVVLEEIEAHLGRQVSAAGYSTASERTRFARSANTAEVSGSEARHGSGRFDAPAEPMSLGEAARFVALCLRRALLDHLSKA